MKDVNLTRQDLTTWYECVVKVFRESMQRWVAQFARCAERASALGEAMKSCGQEWPEEASGE